VSTLRALLENLPSTRNVFGEDPAEAQNSGRRRASRCLDALSAPRIPLCIASTVQRSPLRLAQRLDARRQYCEMGRGSRERESAFFKRHFCTLMDQPNRTLTRDERTSQSPMNVYLLAAHRSCEIIALLISKALRNTHVLHKPDAVAHRLVL